MARRVLVELLRVEQRAAAARERVRLEATAEHLVLDARRPGAPCVEVELSGALPLFPGAPFTVAQSEYSSNPNGPNANFNGPLRRLRRRVHRIRKP